jgi:hypothetical protein
MKQFAVEKSTAPVPEFAGAIAGAIVAITVNRSDAVRL